MNLNKVFLIGNLTADPESRTTASGQQVTRLRIATNRVWTNQNTKEKQEQAEFHSVVLWARLAEIAAQYLAKGRMVFIEGRLQTSSWQDKDGQKKYRTEIIAEQMQMGPRPQETGGNGPGTRASAAPEDTGRTGTKAASVKEEDIPVIDEETPLQLDKEEEIKPEDIPF